MTWIDSVQEITKGIVLSKGKLDHSKYLIRIRHRANVFFSTMHCRCRCRENKCLNISFHSRNEKCTQYYNWTTIKDKSSKYRKHILLTKNNTKQHKLWKAKNSLDVFNPVTNF